MKTLAPLPRPVLIHVGYHKTATSWMQQRLFTSRHGFAQIADHTEVFAQVVQPHGFHFDPAGLRKRIDARLNKLGPNVTAVISSEILSGHPFFGGHESDVYAERLLRIAPGAKILVSIRDQMRILPSVYMQYLLRGGTMRPDQFFAGTNRPGYFGFSSRHFEYDHFIAHYQKLFGTENVHVLTQESVQADAEGAARRLASFAGNTAFSGLSAEAQGTYAPSYPEYAAPVLRRINHVQSSTLNANPIVRLGHTPQGLYRLAGYALRRPPLSTLLKGRKPVSDYVAQTFSGHYAESNARLKKLVGDTVDLSRYN